MEEWDRDYIELVVPDFIAFENDNSGSFQFGTVKGRLDCRIERIANQERIGSAALVSPLSAPSPPPREVHNLGPGDAIAGPLIARPSPACVRLLLPLLGGVSQATVSQRQARLSPDRLGSAVDSAVRLSSPSVRKQLGSTRASR